MRGIVRGAGGGVNVAATVGQLRRDSLRFMVLAESLRAPGPPPVTPHWYRHAQLWQWLGTNPLSPLRGRSDLRVAGIGGELLHVDPRRTSAAAVVPEPLEVGWLFARHGGGVTYFDLHPDVAQHAGNMLVRGTAVAYLLRDWRPHWLTWLELQRVGVVLRNAEDQALVWLESAIREIPRKEARPRSPTGAAGSGLGLVQYHFDEALRSRTRVEGTPLMGTPQPAESYDLALALDWLLRSASGAVRLAGLLRLASLPRCGGVLAMNGLTTDERDFVEALGFSQRHVISGAMCVVPPGPHTSHFMNEVIPVSATYAPDPVAIWVRDHSFPNEVIPILQALDAACAEHRAAVRAVSRPAGSPLVLVPPSQTFRPGSPVRVVGVWRGRGRR